MTTHKNPKPGEKHKATAHKTAKPSPGQTMDIIPKNRIRPHTTSRPVITNGPLVHDNSMTGLSGAPALRVKRHNLTIDPLKDSELTKDDVFVNSASAATTGRQPIVPDAPVASQGVSVEELIAKRGGEKVIDSGDATAEPYESETKPADDTAGVPIPPEDDVKKPWEEFNEPSVDEDAAAEAARLLSHPEHANIAELEATHSSGRRGDDTTQSGEAESKEEAPLGLTQSDHLPDTPAAEEQQPVPAGDSLADALREDDPIAPQEHSQALKDAMQEMDGKDHHGADAKHDKGDVDEKSDVHHRLYEGKPVIVVHKDHGQMSAVAWVLWFIFCLGLAILIVNFLIDAGYIETNYNIPHTDFINN